MDWTTSSIFYNFPRSWAFPKCHAAFPKPSSDTTRRSAFIGAHVEVCKSHWRPTKCLPSPEDVQAVECFLRFRVPLRKKGVDLEGHLSSASTDAACPTEFLQPFVSCSRFHYLVPLFSSLNICECLQGLTLNYKKYWFIIKSSILLI